MFHPQNIGWIPEREEELMRNVDGKGVRVVSLVRKYPDPLHVVPAEVEDVVVSVVIGCRSHEFPQFRHMFKRNL